MVPINNLEIENVDPLNADSAEINGLDEVPDHSKRLEHTHDYSVAIHLHFI